MWFVLIVDGYLGKSYYECDTLSEAEEKADDIYKEQLKLYGVHAHTQILKVVDEY